MAGVKGRRVKALDPERRLRLIQAIKAGAYHAEAAAYAGIAESTFYRMLALGREQQTGIYRQLLDDIMQAERECEVKMVIQWRNHFASDYRAVRDFMERRWPERWGLRNRVTPDGAGGGNGNAVLTGGVDLLNRIATDDNVRNRYNDFLQSLAPATQPATEKTPG